jgi:hypothetical protein
MAMVVRASLRRSSLRRRREAGTEARAAGADPEATAKTVALRHLRTTTTGSACALDLDPHNMPAGAVAGTIGLALSFLGHRERCRARSTCRRRWWPTS